jgi:hypothetical protein
MLRYFLYVHVIPAIVLGVIMWIKIARAERRRRRVAELVDLRLHHEATPTSQLVNSP